MATPGTLSAGAAGEVIAAARTGCTEIPGALDDAPLLVVDVESHDDLDDALPAWLPCVVLARCAGAPSGSAPRGADVALCPARASEPPPGWVAVEDLDGEIARLGARIRRWPQASVVLVQVLRTNAGLSVEAGLTVESLAYSTLQAGPAFGSWLAERRRRAGGERRDPGEAVALERRGGALVVTLDRPQVRNAVDARLRDALAEGLALACADPSITAVELRGSGPDFCSGGDLDQFGTLPDPATAHLVRTGRNVARLLWRLAGVTTVYLHGSCVGAGVEMAAFAGRVVAAPGTGVRLPELSMGLLPGAGGTVSLPRRIGAARTAWLALSGTELDTATASSWGLIDEVAAPT